MLLVSLRYYFVYYVRYSVHHLETLRLYQNSLSPHHYLFCLCNSFATDVEIGVVLAFVIITTNGYLPDRITNEKTINFTHPISVVNMSSEKEKIHVFIDLLDYHSLLFGIPIRSLNNVTFRLLCTTPRDTI